MTADGRAPIVGWDIGGVNTKAARLDLPADLASGSSPMRAASVPFEIQGEPHALTDVLRDLAHTLDLAGGAVHAVTMTAELSQAFRTKREGVAHVLGAVAKAFPDAPQYIYTVRGHFVLPAAALEDPLAVGASNWRATATLVARFIPDGVLVDIGTTSTDIIPLSGGRVVVQGLTDPARLLSRELVYTGAVRTPVEALVDEVPLWGGRAAVSAEGFATTGDAHVWLGQLEPADYAVPSADGRPTTKEFAGERLARVVCGDREMLDEAAIDAIARTVVEAQLARVVTAIGHVQQTAGVPRVAVVTGLGDFIAAEAARRLGFEVVELRHRLGDAARTAPAAAAAWLLADELDRRNR